MNETKVAIDIQELDNEQIFNALLGEKGELFKTARDRRAILIGQAALTRVQRKMNLSFDTDSDGLAVLK